MRNLIYIALLFISVSVLGQQGGFTYLPQLPSAGGAPPDPTWRETDWWELENGVTNTVTTGNGDLVNTGMTFVTSSPTPPNGTYAARATSAGGDYFDFPAGTFSGGDFSAHFRYYTENDNSTAELLGNGTNAVDFLFRENVSGRDLDMFTEGTETNATNYMVSAPTTFIQKSFGITYDFSAGTTKFYYDGVDVTDTDAGTASTTMTGTWQVMQGAIGDLDDVRIYDGEILVAADFLEIHNNPNDGLTE